MRPGRWVQCPVRIGVVLVTLERWEPGAPRWAALVWPALAILAAAAIGGAA